MPLLFRSMFKFLSCAENRLIAKGVLKTWMIINKRHLLMFLDNRTHKSIKPRRRRYNSALQPNKLKSKENQKRLMGWYWKRKPTWRKDLITYNSYLWMMLSLNWLVIIWRGPEGVIWNCMSKVKRVTKIALRWSRGVGVLENWIIFKDVIWVSSLIRERFC